MSSPTSSNRGDEQPRFRGHGFTSQECGQCIDAACSNIRLTDAGSWEFGAAAPAPGELVLLHWTQPDIKTGACGAEIIRTRENVK